MPVKICTGCGRLNTEPLGLNKHGEPYLACCPDNNYKPVTAVEWLRNELKKWASLDNPHLFEHALTMEKEQHSDTWTDSRTEHKGDDYIGKEISFDEYFKRVYGNTDSN